MNERSRPAFSTSQINGSSPRSPLRRPYQSTSSSLRASARASCERSGLLAGPWLCEVAPHPSGRLACARSSVHLRLLPCRFPARVPLSSAYPFFSRPSVRLFLLVSFTSLFPPWMSGSLMVAAIARRFLTAGPLSARPAFSGCPGRFPRGEVQRWPMATRVDRIAFPRTLVTALIAAARCQPLDALVKYDETGSRAGSRQRMLR